MSDLYQDVSAALAAEPLLEGLQLRDHAWATVHGWDGEEEDGHILRSYIEALETEVKRLAAALREEQAESLRQAEIARDALAQASRLAADNYTLAGRVLHAEAEVERMREAFDELERYADDAIGTAYGTLSASFVRGLARAALAGEGDEDE